MSEQFTPESIDSDIEAFLSGDANEDDARLTRALASLYLPPAQADPALKRVHARVGYSSYMAGTELGGQVKHVGDTRAATGRTLSNGQRHNSHRSSREMRTALGAVAMAPPLCSSVRKGSLWKREEHELAERTRNVPPSDPRTRTTAAESRWSRPPTDS